MIPRQIPLLVEERVVIRDGDDAARVSDLLLADTHFVPRDPQDRSRAGDGRVVISVALRLGRVDDVSKIAGHQTAERVVVGILVRTEPFGEEVGLFVRREGGFLLVGGGAAAVLAHAVCASSLSALVVGLAITGHGLAVFEGKKIFFLGFKGLGKIYEKRIDGGIKRDVEKNDENQKGDHEDNGAGSCSRTEETDQANGREIHSHRGLLQCSGIN